MKKGINQWAFLEGKPIKECLNLAKDAGFAGMELNIMEKGELTLETKREELKKIRKIAEAIGIEIPSLCVELPYMLTSDDESERKKAKEAIKESLEIANQLGANAVLVVPGGVDFSIWIGKHKIVDYEVAYERAKKELKDLGATAKDFGVYIGVENVWNKFLLSPLEFRRFIDEINQPYIQAYFDVANVLISGYPEQWIKILDNRIKKVHVKDFKVSIGDINGFVNLLEGDVNWPAVIESLESIGYDDYLIAEVMPPYKFYPERLIYETSESLNSILS